MTDIIKVNNIIDNELIDIIQNDFKNINKIQYIYEKNKDKNIDKKIIKERIQEINSYRKILKELVKEPVIKQRTKEWFDARENRLTASDLYDAIKDSKVSDTIAKKKAKITKDNINYNGIKALKWGTMFEPMASRIYSEINKDINILIKLSGLHILEDTRLNLTKDLSCIANRTCHFSCLSLC